MPTEIVAFSVTFFPSAVGERTATFSIHGSDPLQPFLVTHLYGVGRNPVPAKLEVSTKMMNGQAPEQPLLNLVGTIRFPDTQEAHYAAGTRLITLTNSGSFPLTDVVVSLKGGSTPADFSFYANSYPYNSIPTHGSLSYIVNFLPFSTGEKTAILSIASSDTVNNPFDINLSGLATAQPAPALSLFQANVATPNLKVPLVGNSLDFYGVPLARDQDYAVLHQSWNIFGATKSLILKNTGSGNLIAYLKPSGEGDFNDFFSYPGYQFLLQPGQESTLTVNFIPAVAGPRATSYTLTTNIPGQAQQVVHLAGVGLDTSVQPSPLIISEINYNPPGSGNAPSNRTEFLEIKNISGATLDLTANRFKIEGDDDYFASGASLSSADNLMAPGDIRVFAYDAQGFAARYPGVTVHGKLHTKLDNSSNTLQLSLGSENLFVLTYADSNPWPSLPDGTGFTLVTARPDGNPDPKDPLSWRASTHLYGSPGADDPSPVVSPIVISELKVRDDAAPDSDVFELANLSDLPVDITGWFLSDSSDNLRRFRIPTGTVVPPRGFVTFTQAQVGFGISGAGNDELMLFAAARDGTFTGYKHSALPGPAADRRSFIRTISSDGREFFAPSETTTLGVANSPVHVGPVVFSEISYQPTKDPSAVGRAEFIELVNRSSQRVNLCPSASLPWIIRGIADQNFQDFHFPLGTFLEPGEVLLLLPYSTPDFSYVSPTDAKIAQYRSFYHIPDSVTKIFLFLYREDEQSSGEYRWDNDYLSNNSQKLELLRPETYLKNGATTEIIYVSEDRAHYRDDSGWPNRASGDGPGFLSRSLVRTDPNRFGSEPSSWDSSPAHGGTPGYAATFAPPAVVISEVLAHSDLTNPLHPARADFIELQNTSAQPADISGWWLSASSDKLARAYDKRLANPAYVLADADSVYQIPAGTVLAPGAFWAVNGDDDDNPLTAPPAGFFGRFFSLNSRGDSVRLVAMDAAKLMTGQISKTDFDATENAVSIIRHLNSEGRETYLTASALTTEFNPATAFPAGAPNAPPAVPGVVISELMYAAPPGGFQFIELLNRSSSRIALYDNFNEIPGHTADPRHNPANGWHLPNLGFTFPSSEGNRPSLAAGELLVLTNAPSEAAFRAFHPETPAGVRVLPWGTATLLPGGERLKLQKPDAEDQVNGQTLVPRINVDEFRYAPEAPWPLTGFGGGYSLERRDASALADDASNWRRSADPRGTPGIGTATLLNGGPQARDDQWIVNAASPLTVPPPGILANDYDVDSGSLLTAELLSSPPPAAGTLVFSPDGSFTFSPAAGFAGTTTFTYRVTDATTPGLSPAEALWSAPATVSLALNQPPSAMPDAYTVPEEGLLTGSVLANDTDPNPLDLLSASLVTAPPANTGTLKLNPFGSFEFTPAPDFNGTTTFTYRATDGVMPSDPVLVTITVTPVNDFPRTVDDFYRIGLGEKLIVPAAQGVLANDSDADHDPMKAKLYYIEQPESGTLTLNDDGSFEFTPAAGFQGVFVFHYRASDPSSPGTVQPFLVNDYVSYARVQITVTRDFDSDGLDDAWEKASFGSLGHTATGDADGDGIPNLSEFASGLNPLKPDAQPLILSGYNITRHGLPVVFNNPSLGMGAIYLRRKDSLPLSLQHIAEFSSDLKTWEPDQIGYYVIAEDADFEAIQVFFPSTLNNGQPARFFRLRVYRPDVP